MDSMSVGSKSQPEDSNPKSKDHTKTSTPSEGTVSGDNEIPKKLDESANVSV